MKSGIELISDERTEQKFKHNRSVEHDVKTNNHFQLSDAAGMLCQVFELDKASIESSLPIGWDLAIWEKMCTKPYRERLIIAGALIAAELDRLNELNPTTNS